MEKIYETIERSHKDFICKQNMFFVETAPNTYLILFFLFCGIRPGGLSAQDRNAASSPRSFYVKASAGYGIGINGSYIVNNLNESITITTSKLGNGWYGNASGGYQYNSNLGAELGLGYEYGLKNNTFPPFNGNSSEENGNMWQLTPSIVFSSKTGRLVPYIKTGLIVALPEILEDELVNLIPKKGVLVKDNYDGVSNLSNESTSEKETIFKSSYDPNSPPDSDSPSVSSPVKFSFNAVEFRIGIRMWFGRKPD